MVSRKVTLALVLVSLLSVSSFAGSFGLFGSFQLGHAVTAPTGGIRYSLSDDICLDVGAGAALGFDDSTANGYSLYADAFFIGQTLGASVTIVKDGEADLSTTVALLYALEKSVTEKIVIGVSPSLASYNFAEGNGIKILDAVYVYTVLFW